MKGQNIVETSDFRPLTTNGVLTDMMERYSQVTNMQSDDAEDDLASKYNPDEDESVGGTAAASSSDSTSVIEACRERRGRSGGSGSFVAACAAYFAKLLGLKPKVEPTLDQLLRGRHAQTIFETIKEVGGKLTELNHEFIHDYVNSQMKNSSSSDKNWILAKYNTWAADIHTLADNYRLAEKFTADPAETASTVTNVILTNNIDKLNTQTQQVGVMAEANSMRLLAGEGRIAELTNRLSGMQSQESLRNSIQEALKKEPALDVRRMDKAILSSVKKALGAERDNPTPKTMLLRSEELKKQTVSATAAATAAANKVKLAMERKIKDLTELIGNLTGRVEVMEKAYSDGQGRDIPPMTGEGGAYQDKGWGPSMAPTDPRHHKRAKSPLPMAGEYKDFPSTPPSSPGGFSRENSAAAGMWASPLGPTPFTDPLFTETRHPSPWELSRNQKGGRTVRPRSPQKTESPTKKRKVVHKRTQREDYDMERRIRNSYGDRIASILSPLTSKDEIELRRAVVIRMAEGRMAKDPLASWLARNCDRSAATIDDCVRKLLMLYEEHRPTEKAGK